jgi:hypothetical protein
VAEEQAKEAKRWFHRAWTDPVGSKLISNVLWYGIAGVATLIFAGLVAYFRR